MLVFLAGEARLRGVLKSEKIVDVYSGKEWGWCRARSWAWIHRYQSAPQILTSSISFHHSDMLLNPQTPHRQIILCQNLSLDVAHLPQINVHMHMHVDTHREDLRPQNEAVLGVWGELRIIDLVGHWPDVPTHS